VLVVHHDVTPVIVALLSALAVLIATVPLAIAWLLRHRSWRPGPRLARIRALTRALDVTAHVSAKRVWSLVNNFLYDLAQITIPTDEVDPVYVRRPQRWDIGVIRRFMLRIGPLSSVFDALTFAVLLLVFRFAAPALQTGWFVESLVTQVLVVFVIRTARRPWTNRRASR